MEIEACSKLWRWFEGIVPSGSKGWCRSGPMKSSIEIDDVVATKIMCHSPIIMKPKPGATCPTRVPIYEENEDLRMF
ncbi:hypothetical protein TSUD_140140 [Trifolium subterraneum]|uniref:Uncharacterized protein n=1 Tax=Trifolium subterraneum TaxID=3900 RepID=A0A2Z6LQ34_TRISU|nr:hypothetical protein TSUD_140140 [Trifolium subterraneum]